MPAYKDSKQGTWYASFYFENWQGVKQKKLKRGFATKKDALAWEREFLLQQAADLTMTFEAFVEIYITDKKKRLWENTWSTKEHIIRTKILPYFKEKRLSEIKPRDVIAWQNEMLNYRDKNGKAYSPTYLKTLHGQLSAILNHAVRFYGLKSNAAATAGCMGSEKHKEMLFWTKEEYLKFAEVMMDKPQSYYAFEVLYWCGIREGELLALTPADFDLDKGLLSITKSYLFVGAPKVGKSFFMGQLAYHVAMGLPLWEYEVHQGTVLYLALEDDYARLQRRLSRMFGVEETSNLYFATQAKSVSEGLDQQLEGFIREHPDVRLIIIDTLQKVREIGGDRYSYASDYEIVTRLKTFSDKYGICLLVVHHTRKMEAEDSFDMISGTNGLLGAADGAFIMQKKRRTDNTALLDIVGRDQPDQELTLEFDRERCVWEFQGAETELWKLPPDPLLEAVAKMLSPEQPEWSGTPTELLERLPGVSIQANILTRKLNVSADRLYNDYGIRYESKRTHEGRVVKLTLENSGA